MTTADAQRTAEEKTAKQLYDEASGLLTRALALIQMADQKRLETERLVVRQANEMRQMAGALMRKSQ